MIDLFHDMGPFEGLTPGILALHEARYQEALNGIPAPGMEQNCHTSLLGVATLGIRAGHGQDELFEDIKAAIPLGKRTVSDQEIRNAIKRAMQDTVPAGSDPAVRPSVEFVHRKRLSEAEASKVRASVLSFSNGPVELDNDAFRSAHGFQLEQQLMAALYPDAFSMIQLLRELYAPEDLLYIGPERMMGSGLDNIRSAAEWLIFFEEQQHAILERIGNEGWSSPEPSAFLMDLGMRFSHIVPNPVTGCSGKTKGGKLSLRCDDSIGNFRYAVIDFDGYDTIEEQGEVLHCLCESMDIRICALIHTGGRGCHAWVKIDGVDSLDSWNEIVRDGLFPTFEALGADPACANPSRASRLPGVYRPTTAHWQKLITLNKKGFAV